MDIKTWLIEAKGALSLVSDSPKLDADILLSHVLDKTRSYLFTYPEKTLSKNELQSANVLLSLRLKGKPIAYLIGKQSFYSLDFKVNEHVLIPRPDSECLIDFCLETLHHNTPAKILDLGTGSGALALTLAYHLPKSKVIAADICPKALAVAKENQAYLNIKNISFIQSDWFNQLEPTLFDLIIANPPYISESDKALCPNSKQYEPVGALIAPNEGLACLEAIILQSSKWLKPNSTLIVEHGYQQSTKVKKLFESNGYRDIVCHFDLNKKPRAVSGKT